MFFLWFYVISWSVFGIAMISQSASSLIQTTPTDVSHPLDDVMIGIVEFWFEDFQVADFKPRGSKRHLKYADIIVSTSLKRNERNIKTMLFFLLKNNTSDGKFCTNGMN